MDIAIDDHSHASRHSHATYSGDIGLALGSNRPEANSVGFVRRRAADINVTGAIDQSRAGVKANRDVIVAADITRKGEGAHRRVKSTVGIGEKGLLTDGDIIDPDGILVQRLVAIGGVVASVSFCKA